MKRSSGENWFFDAGREIAMFTKLLHHTLAIYVLTLGLPAWFVASPAVAKVIVRDEFNGTDGTKIHGRTPNIAPAAGRTWQSITVKDFPRTIASHRAKMGAISIATLDIRGSYAKTTKISISATVNLGSVVFDGHDYRGVYLGFESADGATVGDFTGLAVQRDGSLHLLVASARGGLPVMAGRLESYVGEFDPTADHTLSYTIDTATGAISDILFDGQSKSTTTDVFTVAHTAKAAMGVYSGADNTYGYIGNFVVQSVHPDPAAAVLIIVDEQREREK